MFRCGDEITLKSFRGAILYGNTIKANQAAASFFGFENCARMVDENFFRKCTAAGENSLMSIFDSLIKGNTISEGEVQFQTVSNETIDILLRLTLPANPAGWKRVLVTGIDVTARNCTQVRLKKVDADLTQIARCTTLEEFAATVAHEVNQPLSAIITYAKSGQRWLAHDIPNTKEMADCFTHIASNGVRAENIISRMIDLYVKKGPVRDHVDLLLLVQQVVDILQDRFQKSMVKVNLSSPIALPGVIGDGVQLQQVFVNLLLNAEQAMYGVEPNNRQICVELTSNKTEVTVQIKDRGVGIDSQEIEKVFWSFYTTKENSMGMGLAICRSIIEYHGGFIAALPRYSGGAIIAFSLPITDKCESVYA